MKRYDILIFAALAASCTAESVPTAESGAAVFCASVGEDGSRTVHSDLGDRVSLNWAKGDGIGIWSADAGAVLQSNSEYVALEDAASSDFGYVSRKEMILWKSDVQSFYACYPYSASAGEDFRRVKFDLPPVQRQKASSDMEHLSRYDFLWAAAEDVARGEDALVSLAFHHSLAVLDLELQTDKRMVVDAIVLECVSKPEAALAFTDGSIDLATGELTPGVPSSSIRLDCGFASSWPSASHFYICFNPALQGETLRISIVVAGEKKTLAEKTLPALSAGKMLTLKANYNVSDAEAIRIVNLSEISTANCYLVTKPSEYYMFDARVKGNGHIPAQLSSVVTESSITPGSVLILWYNCLQTSNDWVDECPIEASSLTLVDGYVFFDTPSNFVNGNVVLAAFEEKGVNYDNITVDADGNINNATLLWSWNIWAVEGLDLEAEALRLDYRDAGGNLTPFTIMKRNLGAVLDGSSISNTDKRGYAAAAALGNMYQWGRKDPLPGIADYENYWPIGNANKLICTPTYTPVVALQKTPSTSETLTRQLFIQKPGTIPTEGNGASDESIHIFDKASVNFTQAINAAAAYPYKYFGCAASHTYDKHWFPNDPAVDPWKSLWGDLDKDDGTALEKTLFDPCPPGWKLWQEETINAFVQNGASTASIAPCGHGLMVAGSYFGYNAGGRNANMGQSYGEPVVICGYACPIGLIAGTASDRYNHRILRYTLWKSPTSAAGSTISVAESNPSGSDAKQAGAYSVRCIKE